MQMMKKMPNSTTDGLPLVAIDMGSCGFRLMVAKQDADSKGECSPLRLLAVEQSNRYDCVSKGSIENSSNASYMLREMLLLASNSLKMDELPTAVTLYGGRSMRCQDVHAMRYQGVKNPISRALLDNMQNECLSKMSQAKASQPIVAVDAVPAVFQLDDELVTGEPEEGSLATKVHGTYSTFWCLKDGYDKMVGTFDRAGKSIEHAFARPHALVEALATEEDEFRGLGIIDMGADTTTFTAYKQGRYLMNRTVPLGGNNITRDIAMLGISKENAEKLKLRFGNAQERPNDKCQVRVPAENGDEKFTLIPISFLSHVISSRLDEIMFPIFELIHNLEDEISVIYLTGGASKMAGMVPYVEQHTHDMHVSHGSHADWLADGTDPLYYQPEYSALVGALLLNAKYRRQHPNKKLPETLIKRFFRKGIEKGIGLFDMEN